jgi:hypothetical protein
MLSRKGNTCWTMFSVFGKECIMVHYDARREAPSASNNTLSNGAKTERPPNLVGQLHSQVSSIRNGTLDCAATVRNAADDITGPVPECDNTEQPMNVPVSGALGALFEEVGHLQNALEQLRMQVERLRSIAS